LNDYFLKSSLNYHTYTCVCDDT